MNVQTIQSASTKAFTLIELIVVITILAILGTVGYQSFQGYTANARNTKRMSDTDTITKTIAETRAKSAYAVTNYITPGVNQLATTSAAVTNSGVSGFTGSYLSGANYSGGDINYIVLGLKQSDFQDPAGLINYRIGATTYVGGAYEVAASLEDGDSRYAYLKGNYNPRSASTGAITSTSDSAGLTFSISPTQAVYFDPGDAVTFTAGTCLTPAAGVRVSSVSTDGRYIIFSAKPYTTQAAGCTGVVNIAAEMAGLVATGTITPAGNNAALYGTCDTTAANYYGVVKHSRSCLPY